MTELRTEWTCSGCGCNFRREDGEPYRPVGWTHGKCFGCCRKGESAEEAARRMLLEGVGENNIYRNCPRVEGGKKLSREAIQAIRAELVEAGELEPGKEPPATGAAKKEKPEPAPPSDPRIAQAEAALRKDPQASNSEVGELVGLDAKAVSKARRSAGLPDASKARRQEVQALLTENPGLSSAEVRNAMPDHPPSPSLIRKVRRELGIRLKPGPRAST